MAERIYQAAIIGAGPIGLELAVAMKRSGIDYVHFDAKQIGYTVSWYPPMTRFFSSNNRIAIAGVPLATPDQGKATREQYLCYLRNVVEQFDLRVRTYEPVVQVNKSGEIFTLISRPAGGEVTTRARNVIFATGGTDRPRRLGIDGEDLPHVTHYLGDPHQYFRRSLHIIGGRNSAIEAALRCHHAGAKVSISYRRPKFLEKGIKYWLTPELNSLIRAGAITAYFGTIPTLITPTEVRMATMDNDDTNQGEDASVEEIFDTASDEGSAEQRREWSSGDIDKAAVGLGSGHAPFRGRVDTTIKPRTVAADAVLALIGYEQDSSLLRQAGVELLDDDLRPKFDRRTMATNVPGLYVAGTSVGGTQRRYTVFIENCHVHVERIMKAAFGVSLATTTMPAEATELPES